MSEQMDLKRVRWAGEQLSNCAFNLAQPGATLDERAKGSLDTTRKDWDGTARPALERLADRLQHLEQVEAEARKLIATLPPQTRPLVERACPRLAALGANEEP